MDILKLYRLEDLPDNYTGIIGYGDNTIIYLLNGLFHREDGPAFIYPNSRKEYFLNGKLHRKDGPAVITSFGNRFYYLNGKLHREDGPAAIYSNGIENWYLNGNDITEEINDWIIGKTDIPPYEKWDNNTRLIFKLTFG